MSSIFLNVSTHLVVVGLCQLGVLKELIGGEYKVELESGLVTVEIRQSNVNKMLESFLISVGNSLSSRDVVLQSSQPELGDTLDILAASSLLLGLLLLLFLNIRVFQVRSLAGLNLGFSRLSLTLDNGLSTFVKGLVLDKELHTAERVSILSLNRQRGPQTFFSNSRMANWNSPSISECLACTPFKPSILRRTARGSDSM